VPSNKRSQVPSPADRLDLFKKSHERILSTYREEQQRRPKHELFLIVTCVLAVSYTYPVVSFDQNPLIEIPSISLKIPLRDAIAVFPTIIATLYIICLSAALRQSQALFLLAKHERTLRTFQQEGKLNDVDYADPIPIIRYILLPTPLHQRGWNPGVEDLFRAVMESFVGFVFGVLPYVAAGFITYRSWVLLHTWWIVGWNIACVLVMILGFITVVLTARSAYYLSP